MSVRRSVPWIAVPFVLLAAPVQAQTAVRPCKNEAVRAQTVGALCKFDIAQLSFAGTPVEQAACLLRAPAKWGHLKQQPITLPDVLAQRVGKPTGVTKEALRGHLASLGLSEAMVGGSLDEPLSRARDNAANAPMARYFVIHDTSTPNFHNAAFPADIDKDADINQLDGYAGPQSKAHAFINRTGKILIGHPFSTPWRATNFECQLVGGPSKGLFIHIENVQPRRRDPRGGAKNDAIAPVPGLSDAQYATLALLYVAASIRAGQWMIPAMHAPLDEAMPDHDDPQNFDLEGKLAPALQALITKLGG